VIASVRRDEAFHLKVVKMRISLREFLSIVLATALMIASLSVGGVVASITAFIGIVALMATAIVAFVGYGQPRAFAIGFLLPIVVYAALILIAGPTEMDLYDGRLPTTQMLQPIHNLLVKRTYTYGGKVIPKEDVKNYSTTSGGGGMMGAPTLGFTEVPDRNTFMSLAHGFIGIVLGWIGGKFAVFIYHSKTRASQGDEQSIPSEPRPRRS
jgi:hypothetical protein